MESVSLANNTESTERFVITMLSQAFTEDNVSTYTPLLVW